MAGLSPAHKYGVSSADAHKSCCNALLHSSRYCWASADKTSASVSTLSPAKQGSVSSQRAAGLTGTSGSISLRLQVAQRLRKSRVQVHLSMRCLAQLAGSSAASLTHSDLYFSTALTLCASQVEQTAWCDVAAQKRTLASAT